MPPKLRSFTDTSGTRAAIFKNVTKAFEEKFPLVGKSTELHLSDVKVKEKKYSLAEQKEALLEGRDLSVPITGTVTLRALGGKKILDEKKVTLARVPYLTPRGTAISGGNEYAIINQFRLRPGVYNRLRDNGEIESHFNTKPGSGPSFRLGMDTDTGVFRMQMGNSNRKLYPLLHAGGVDDKTLEKSWGKDVLKANKESHDPRDINNIYQGVFRRKPDEGLSEAEKAQEIFGRLAEGELDKDVTLKTLGTAYGHVSKPAIIDASTRILGINRGTHESDDRDSLTYRTLHGPEDFLAEKIRKDAGGLQKRLMWKIEGQPEKSLAKLNAGYFTPQLRSLFSGDSRALPLEEINPVDLLDQQNRATSLGEGGIPTSRAVPNDARDVHASQMGFVDPIRGPESENIGIDTRIAWNTFKGDDNKPYAPFVNAKTKKQEMLSPDQTMEQVIAFPGELEKPGRRVRVLDHGKLSTVDRGKVTHTLANANEMFATSSNLVPMSNSVSGGRGLMAGKAQSQALPFAEPDAPLVRTRVPGTKDKSFVNLVGRLVGSHEAKVDGEVTRVGKDSIDVRADSGETTTHDRYNMFPFNRSTFIHSKAQVKAGDKVKKGDILASTNFTDDEGNLSLGKNLRSAYVPYKGYGFEDGIVISESAAKKLTSDHLYSSDLDADKDQIVNTKKYVSYFPTNYTRDQTAGIDDEGVIKPGTKVKPGDPLILALKKRALSTNDAALGKLHKVLRQGYADNAVTWDQDTEGEVIDVVKNSSGVKLNVRTLAPAKVADKLSGVYGNKGVISKILPDDQMPHDSSGQPLEILLNPLGTPSRLNPAQAYEALLGKVARKTGKPILVDNFSPESFHEFTKAKLKEHGVSDTEDLTDPTTGRVIPNVLTGESYIMKIAKTAKSGFSAREIGPSYTADQLPSKGGKEGAKRIGNLDVNALVAHDARENLRDMFSVKGQRNDAYWKAMRLGLPLPSPEPSFINEKFRNSLKAGGINIQKKGEFEKLLPLTDSETEALSKGEVKNARMFRRSDMQPEKGGLFDFGITGGPRGARWGHVELSQPLPNPVMEEPVRRMLGLTENKLRSVLSNQEEFDGKTGGKAIQDALGKLDVDAEIKKHKDIIASGRKSFRDNSVKVLGYLKSLKENKIKPQELMITKVPVIPPVFRPVSFIGGSTSIISPANQLYADLLHTTSSVQELGKDLPDSALGAEKLGEYDAVKAVTGIGDPVGSKTQAKGAKGFLREIIGNIPKTGMFQRKILSKPQDLAGRAVVVPDPALGMDEVGLPEEMAWKLYRPFIMRRLVKKGMGAVQADKEIEERTPRARDEMMAELDHRPVVINRAPTLHKFGIMAAKPVLRNDKSLAVPALVAAGFNLDHDGDQMNVYVPASESARVEAHEKLLPSKNLFALRGKYPIHSPVQEAVLGMFNATAEGTGKVRKFASKKDALIAYHKGEISMTDPIDVEGL